ncbi:conjugal transfer protein TraD [Legionella pneumophila serogroup 1]|uniref:conjugal transfer protein TraD n=1 Tax=Legionella pneumophila TaxID=446 RepID=UPI001980BA1E|nr:conjugal transfer protein TraD [Legionella pneumophila]MBN5929498.1 conjugal transfer protein TraD [Legionella pneumophila]
MDTSKQIKKQEQIIAREEKVLALAKLKQRKADTRRKIELGGLVIKSGMGGYDKATILGALDYALSLMGQDKDYANLFIAKGNHLFLIKQ